MSDNMMPELTLNPTEAAQEAVPELTLTPEAPTAPETEKKEVEPVKVDESMLTEQEKKAVDDFAKKIDITDTNLVLNYGVAAQKSVATFSENALSSVRNKDLGEVGETLSNLVVEVKGFGQEEKKGFAGLFHKQKDKLELMRAQYGKAETSVNRIVSELEKHQVTLMKDIAMLDQMYELNLKYYKDGVQLNYSAINLMLLKKQVDEAKATYRKYVADYEQQRQNVYLEVKSAYISLLNSHDSLDVSKLALQQAKERQYQAFRRYQVGLGDAIEFKDAENSYLNAQLDYYSNLLNYNVNAAEVERVIGAPIHESSQDL